MSATASPISAISRTQAVPVYEKIYALSFETLPSATDLREIPGLKAMQGQPHRYRIRVASYRIGIEISGTAVELVRVLDRREFYRYFP